MNTRRHADDHFVSTRGNKLWHCKILAIVKRSLHVLNNLFLKIMKAWTQKIGALKAVAIKDSYKTACLT